MNLQGNEKYIKATNNTISEESAIQRKINVSEPGTVIFPKIGGAIATNKRRILVKKTAIDNNCLGIRPFQQINLEWFFLILNAIDMAKYQSGTSVPAINQSVIGNIVIALPSEYMQARIVAKVEELMSLCDQLEQQSLTSLDAHQQLVETLLATLTDSQNAEQFAENWTRISQHFEILFTTEASIDALKQTILQLAVMGKLVPQDPNDEPASELLKRIELEKAQLLKEGKIKKQKLLPPVSDEEKPFELPQGWEWVCWGELLAYDDGAFKRGPFGSSLTKSMFISEGYKVYEQYCPINDDCSFERYYISDEKFEELRGFAVKAGDFLVSCTGATLGRITQVPQKFKEGVINQALLRVRINKGFIDADFFKLLFRSPFFQKNIFENSKGSAIPNLKGVNDLKAMPIPFLSIHEQYRIVAKVNELMAICEQLKVDLKSSKITQLHLADALTDAALN